MYSPLEQFNILNNGFLSNHMYILILVLFVMSIFLINSLSVLKNTFFQCFHIYKNNYNTHLFCLKPKNIKKK